jgi:hypothetical protein
MTPDPGPAAGAAGASSELENARGEGGRFLPGNQMAKGHGRPLGAKDIIPRAFKQRLRAALDGSSSEYTNIVDKWFAAIEKGLEAEPPYSVGYCRLVAEAGLVKEAGGSGRGLTIVLPRGGGYDPMARPGDTPVIRIGRGVTPAALPAGEPELSEPDPGLDAVLGRGDERLEMVDDAPTRCPDCRGRGWRDVGGAAGDTKTCRLCEGSGNLG